MEDEDETSYMYSICSTVWITVLWSITIRKGFVAQNSHWDRGNDRHGLVLGWEYCLALEEVLKKEALQERVLTVMHRFNGYWRGVVVYSCGMAVCELLSMSMIPVETAAGVVFGFRKGFLASAIGKLVGAALAYALWRGVLKMWILETSQENLLYTDPWQVIPFERACSWDIRAFPNLS